MKSAAVETWFGEAFTQLHPLLQALHRSGGVVSGQVDVHLGTGLAGWVGRRLARRLGITVGAGGTSMRVAIYSDEKELHWDRTFNDACVFASTFTPSGRYPTGHWVETSGLLCLKLGVTVLNGAWEWKLMGASLWGIALPTWVWPRTSASKHIENGQYRFNVEIGLPWLGTVLSYGGKLDAAPAEVGLPATLGSEHRKLSD
jgi:hypothetical protein